MDSSWAENIRIVLEQKLGEAAQFSEDAYFASIKVESSAILSLMQVLRDDLNLNYLANLTAVDYDAEFELVYHLYAIPDTGCKIAVKTRLPRGKAEAPSLVSFYPTADWQEREIYDLMGIRFTGHPNLVRILLPDDFEGHPLRKDFKKEV